MRHIGERACTVSTTAAALAEPAAWLCASSMASSRDVACFARVRPMDSAAPYLRAAGGSLSVGSGRGSTFAFDAVFGQAGGADGSQQTIYDTVGARAVSRVVAGQNVAFVAHGQALAGKRWTLLGDLDSPPDHGIVPRAVAQLLATVPGRGGAVATGGEYELRLSWVEVCEERLFDLLRPGSDELQLGDSPARGGQYVLGLSAVGVDSAESALALLRTGVSCGRHGLSHTVLSLTVRQRRQDASMRVATLTAVECAPPAAGSARTATAALAAVVSGGGGDPAAYRASKLTRLLLSAGVFGGNCATHIFACCHPSKDHKDATLSTCKFATDAQQLPNFARTNDHGSPDELAEYAACLRADEAAMRQHSSNLEDILAQLGVQAGGLSSGKSFFASKKKDKRADSAVAAFDPHQVLRMTSECDRLMRSRQQALADCANLEAEVASAKSVNAGLMMDISEVTEAMAQHRESAPPLIEELRALRAETAGAAGGASGAVAQHGSMEMLQLEAKAEELRTQAKATRAALAAAKRREQALTPKLVPTTDKLYRVVAQGSPTPTPAALAGAQQAAAAQQSRASAASSTAIGSASVGANSGGEDAGSGLTFDLLESTFGCTQLAPPVAVAGATGGASELSGMTQTDGTVRENGIFGPFIYKMHYFTKTGSGQT